MTYTPYNAPYCAFGPIVCVTYLLVAVLTAVSSVPYVYVLASSRFFYPLTSTAHPVVRADKRNHDRDAGTIYTTELLVIVGCNAVNGADNAMSYTMGTTYDPF